MIEGLIKHADDRNVGAWAVRFRKKRFAFFRTLLASLPRPLKILDIGGTPVFWERMGMSGEEGVEISILNLVEFQDAGPGFHSLIGDGRELNRFEDGEFDVVFSNSVIEHLPDYRDQRRMAGEMRRVGKRYYLQTPNKYFPFETHFLFPCFQFLPIRLRVWLVSHFNIGWYRKRSVEEAVKAVHSIKLLTERELKMLFPDGAVSGEKFLGLKKSLIVCGGWGTSPPGR